MSRSGDEKTLVCGLCKVLPETLLLEDGSYRLECGNCGRQADRDVAIREGAQQISDDIIKEHQERTRRAMRGLQGVEYIPGRIPQRRTPPFIYI